MEAFINIARTKCLDDTYTVPHSLLDMYFPTKQLLRDVHHDKMNVKNQIREMEIKEQAEFKR